MPTERLLATYRIHARRQEAERLARWIAVEQTVEVPEAVYTAVPPAAALVAAVEEVREVGPDLYEATLAYRMELAAGGLNQVLNLLCGNVTWLPNVRLERVQWPASLLHAFHGPRYGVPGLRARLGVTDRPLLCTALKPRGRSVAELAALARAFAAGGGDIVKDDHNLVDADLEAFRRRTAACQEAVAGTPCRYFPYLLRPQEELDAALRHLERIGVTGLLVAPLLLGLDQVRALAAVHPFALMAHPTFLGAFVARPEHGVAPGLFLGTLLRVAGCDAVVFPHAGGRFPLTPETCAAIAEAARGPLGKLRPAWPVPAGGMTLENVSALVRTFGRDTILLVGGDLLRRPEGVEAGTQAFRQRVREALRALS